MVLNVIILVSGFALGLFIGIVAGLINKIISAFSAWILRW